MTTQFTHPDKYDFFISHNSADKVIAEEVATKLRNHGYVVAFDAWYVPLGGHLARWMDHAINNSDRLIAICSKDYFKPSAIYSAEERIDMWWGDMEGLNAAVIPFKVAECDLPRTLAVRLYASLSNGDVDAFIDQLLTPAGPWYGFTRSKPIIGRDVLLGQLKTSLEQQPGAAITAVNGMGGVGKTALARAYGDQHRDDYHGGIWITATTRQAVIDGLAKLHHLRTGKKISKPSEDDAAQELQALCQSGQNWLLVYDNVENRADIDRLLPHAPNVHVIVTSRRTAGWDGMGEMSTSTLAFENEDDPAVQLLLREAGINGPTDRAGAARDLAERLGGLPLALVHAGAMNKRGHSFEHYDRDLTAILERAPSVNEDYPNSLVVAVQISYAALPSDARTLLDIMCWWGEGKLTASLFTGAQYGGRWGATKDEIADDVQALICDQDRVIDAFATLRDLSILQRSEPEQGGVNPDHALHRLTSMICRGQDGGKYMSDTAAAILAAQVSGHALPHGTSAVHAISTSNIDLDARQIRIKNLLAEMRAESELKTTAHMADVFLQVSTSSGNVMTMLGHNGPPEAIEDSPVSTHDVQRVSTAVARIALESNEMTPAPKIIASETVVVESFLWKVAKWFGGKLDKSADEFFRAFGKLGGKVSAGALGTYLLDLAGYLRPLVDAAAKYLPYIGG